jgi:hypothetical protein
MAVAVQDPIQRAGQRPAIGADPYGLARVRAKFEKGRPGRIRRTNSAI